MRGIRTDIVRQGKSNLSLFLTFIIFFFLLFLEYFSDENEAYETLCTDIRDLLFRLTDLQKDINNQAITITGTMNGKIGEKIDGLIQTLNDALNLLATRVPGKEIKKTITISSQKDDALSYLASFSPLSTYDSSILLEKLNNTENIWKSQIQQKVNEAISNATH